MEGFYFRLELEDGTPADPPILHTAVPNWGVGDTIQLREDAMLRRNHPRGQAGPFRRLLARIPP